jgi:purine nucleosidase/pyrimidine-specific ribonucleoside hydrolase
MPRRIIIDTDPGVDDALALLLALRSPELLVEAITVVSGNVHLDLCVENTFRILDAAGISQRPPVARGCARPLERDPVEAAHVHGDDGLGQITKIRESDGRPRYPAPAIDPAGRHAVDVILDLIGDHPGQISIVALGPLTNIATAIRKDAATMRQVQELIVMGGSFNGQGNVTPVAEFNFYADPEAARVVVQSGINLTVVGLDVTHRTILPQKALPREELPRKELPGKDFAKRIPTTADAYSRFLRDVTAKWFDFAEGRGLDGAYLHDPLAMGVAIDPSFVRTETFLADVETRGDLTQGMVVIDQRGVAKVETGSPIRGCVEVDAERFVSFFLSRLAG